MGTNYVVVPLNEECADALGELGIAHPPALSSAVSPSPNQLMSVLKTIPMLISKTSRTPQHSAIYINVERTDDSADWTEIVLLNVTDDDCPCDFGFRHGSMGLIVKIAEAVAESCGAQVIWYSSGEDPTLCLPANAT